MANKFSNRADFSIPESLIDEHEWISDALIDGPLGCNCLLEYPPVDSECPNCLFDPSTGRSAGIYRIGGPAPFPNHTTCPWCGGEGRKLTPVTDTVRLRVYFGGMEVNAAMRQFQNLTKTIDTPDGLIFVIGYKDDLPKFERADAIFVNKDQTIKDYRCSRLSEAIPWGFRRNRYFACMLQRA
jgi:hypothetical protein